MVLLLLYAGYAKMLRIRRSPDGGVLSLSGRIGMEDVAELQRLLSLEPVGREMVLDLKDVTLIDRDAVKFLAQGEADSVKLENCPAYIRNWIDAGRDGNWGKNAELS